MPTDSGPPADPPAPAVTDAGPHSSHGSHGSHSTRSRRERPAKPALTRAGIIATAVGLMHAEGLKRVTMRRLAQELDTGPASLYVYVGSTAELHAAILDELLGTVDLATADPAPADPPVADLTAADGNWRSRLEDVLTSYTLVLFEHPGLAQSALVARPSGEHYLRLVETLLSLLAEGGVPAGQAAWGVDVLLQFATATAAEHAGRDTASATARDDWDAVAAAVRGASPRTHPQLAALGADLLSGPPEARLSWGFQLLINGIQHTPRPATGRTAPGRPSTEGNTP
ncbi:transcriptional regulator, TetR family [Streptomyces sp. DvalAA-14]|uniref:TetR/AcrR family transcriptional regulator n=1 Tax=unclassified Streptomyces TaxID=2593676 RepID=UPI00081BB519|nr:MULTISPECIES: TetR/AcrR family transcriptional regulator [unclassified Streptomyces]MYS21595.1 TetR family transcriptional regulator [Streptomyces sp. SID4948]SCD96415.1 transcriptional regulator, TetR family [Streptomyces sp. DvalAA-14]